MSQHSRRHDAPRAPRRRSNQRAHRASPNTFLIVLAITLVAVLGLLGALAYWMFAPEPPAAVPRGAVAGDGDLSAIAARPAIRRDQTSPFSAGWRVLDPEYGFNVVVPVTCRLKESQYGPHDGGGQMRHAAYGGANADAAVGIIWESYEGVDPAFIDNVYRNRPTLDPTQDNSHLEVVSNEFETFLGLPARREILIVRFAERVAYTEQLTVWSDVFSLSVSLGADGETRPHWANRFFDTISVGDAVSGQPPLPELRSQAGESVQLIPEVAVFGSEVVGEWEREGDELVGRGAQALLTLPVIPPPAYQLTVEARRESGSESLGIGFVAGGRQCRFGIDEYSGRRSGLSLLDHRNTLQQPATETDYGNLLGNDWNTITLTVLPKGSEFRIVGTVNGQIIVDWTGDPSRLSHPDSFWKPVPDLPFLTIWENEFRFRRIELRDLTPLEQ